ncbi:ABC transporter ATP-binding protein [Chitinophaga arvensicola]|uniref:ABC-2 type transport system ATP-binding protein n=1 Tax=Chitinophaga arvensicola TaxID=29529 RepID=A0A1I0NLI5_9BACT|nr:ABC transporter ATP-binding protein [Chitinophaga arvensicola]SEW02040.1 ABC-2 type transport system ATP-binding protein [Chitinophaga arvensicola]
MKEPIIKVSNLSHRYNVQWAVKDISFEFNTKGIYGLLGANGAGKSTLMNIMCGVLNQTHGEIHINGISLRDNPVEAKKHIGFLPQQPPLQPELTIEEYLTYCAHLRLMPEASIKTAVQEVMEKCKISHFAKRIIKNLSGGYQQRVGIAQAIIHRPDFIVLDEPTNGLDPNQILEVRSLIKEIAEERTVLLSTHILQEVQALCDDIWMINEGHIIFSGSLDEFDNYIMPSMFNVTLLAGPSTEELAAIPGIVGVETVGNTKYRLQFDNNRDIIENFVKISVARDWRLVEISLEKNSLNTVFAELSRKKTKQLN